jgi:hypothetical protein
MPAQNRSAEPDLFPNSAGIRLPHDTEATDSHLFEKIKLTDARWAKGRIRLFTRREVRGGIFEMISPRRVWGDTQFLCPFPGGCDDTSLGQLVGKLGHVLRMSGEELLIADGFTRLLSPEKVVDQPAQLAFTVVVDISGHCFLAEDGAVVLPTSARVSAHRHPNT